jgi:hypothetical protein
VNKTILSGDIQDTPGDESDDVFHVVTVPDREFLTKISGFVIEYGNANDPNDVMGQYGGGVLVISTEHQSAVHINRCVIRNNRALRGGAGAAILWREYDDDPDKAVRLVNCTFRQNYVFRETEPDRAGALEAKFSSTKPRSAASLATKTARGREDAGCR